MAEATGVACILEIGGSPVPALLQACSADVQRAARPIIVATGGTNPLLGYAPSTGARSGFQTSFLLPYNNAATALNGALSTAGVNITLQLGTAGGVSIASCLVESLEVTGTEGGNIECRATFQSAAGPVPGATASPGTFTDIYKFVDVTSYTLVSGTDRSIVNSFTFRITRQMIAYRGNSPTGRPQRLSAGHTEVEVLAEYLKVDDLEGQAFTPDCPTEGDITVLLTSVCGSSNTLTLVAQSSFYQHYPKNAGNVEDYVRESIQANAVLGQFSISGT